MVLRGWGMFHVEFIDHLDEKMSLVPELIDM